MAKQVDVGLIADEVANRIVGGEADDRLTWLKDGHVRVEMGQIFPARSGFTQTVQGRRRRLREAVIDRLCPIGWTHLGRNTFGRSASRQICLLDIAPVRDVKKRSLNEQ